MGGEGALLPLMACVVHMEALEMLARVKCVDQKLLVGPSTYKCTSECDMATLL